MSNLLELISKINKYSSDAHWDYQIVKFAATTQELITQADDFDFKDEELSNQFEAFMSAYKDLVNSLNIDQENLDSEALEDAGQLIDTLKRRYDRIINNPYLNAKEEEGYEEDFNPGDFTKFISDVAQSAEDRLKAVAGNDVDISEMRAAQYANEFNNNQNIDRGDKNITWTGDKVRQVMEARKRWFEDLMFRKKLNINDPRYQAYIAVRRNAYQNMLEDPARKAAYRANANKRRHKWQETNVKRRSELLGLIQATNDPQQIEKLKAELAVVDAKLARSHQYKKHWADKIRDKKQSGTLEGLTIILQQKLASRISDIKKQISKDPNFTPFKKEVMMAKLALTQEATPLTQKQLEEAVLKEALAMQNHPVLSKVKSDFKSLYSFRDYTKQINSTMGSLSKEELKNKLNQLIADGQRITNDYKEYQSPIVTIREIVELAKNHLEALNG